MERFQRSFYFSNQPLVAALLFLALSGFGPGSLVTASDEVANWEQVGILEQQGRPTQVAYSPNGDKLAVGSFDVIYIWNTKTWERERTLAGLPSGPVALAWSPDNRRVAAGSFQKLNIWDAQTGAVVREHTIPQQWIRSVAWSPEGDKVATGLSNRTITIWNAESGEVIRTLTALNEVVSSLAWAPDAQQIVCGSWQGGSWLSRNAAEILDVSSGERVRTLRAGSFSWIAVAWSPDGLNIATALNTITIWNAQTGRAIRSLGGDRVTALAWSPDGGKLASASYDRTIRIWDADAGGLLKTLTGHTAETVSVHWSPDGDTAASAAPDGTVRRWGIQPSRIRSYALPQVANGQADTWSIKTTVALINPSNNPVWADVVWTRDDGSPLVVNLAGQESGSAFRIELPPGNTRRLQTDGLGPLAVGAAVVRSNAAIGVSATFSIAAADGLVSEAAVVDASELTRVTVPVDTVGGADVGIHLLNLSPFGAQITLNLLDSDGRVVESGSRPLHARFHEAKFVNDLFTRMPTNFRGALSLSSSVPIAVGALRHVGLRVANLPITTDAPRRQSYLPHVTNGQTEALTLTTTFLLANPSESSATADLTLTQSDGTPLVVNIPDLGSGSAFRIELAPGGTRRLQTDGSGWLAGGAAVISADVPITVSALLSMAAGEQPAAEVGVPSSPGLNQFTIPVDTTDGAAIGWHLFNYGQARARLTLHLLDSSGRLVDRGLRLLPAGAHEAGFLDGLFTAMPADFKGTLAISSSVPVSASALRLTGNGLVHLPIVRGAYRP